VGLSQPERVYVPGNAEKDPEAGKDQIGWGHWVKDITPLNENMV
jgi:hypothetical protein